MRYLKVLVIAVLSVTLLVIIGTVHSGSPSGTVLRHSSIFETCTTELAPPPKAWTISNVNLEHTVRLTLMADVCRNSLLGSSSISAFHIVAIPEHSGPLAEMSPDDLQQLLDHNTLVDLNTSTIGQIRPAIVMPHELPKGIVEYDIREESTTRRDFGIEFLCNQQCDPGKIHVRLRTALGANFYYVLFNPDPIAL